MQLEGKVTREFPAGKMPGPLEDGEVVLAAARNRAKGVLGLVGGAAHMRSGLDIVSSLPGLALV